MERKNYRKIRCPEYADCRYIIMEGEIFINISAKDARVLARIVPSARRASA